MAEHELYETEEARRRALRRLSGALGRHVTEDEIDWTSSVGDVLVGTGGGGWSLMPSNAVYVCLPGDGGYLRNGSRLTDVEVERLYAR